MASDLVERLRSEGCRNGGDGSYAWLARELCSKAADEIERLRARLEWTPEFGDDGDGIACRNDTIKLQDERISRLTERLSATTNDAPVERLGIFGHHPDARTDYECEIDALIGMAYERLTMGGHPDLEDRIRKAMEFRTLSTPGELRWLNQTSEVAHAPKRYCSYCDADRRHIGGLCDTCGNRTAQPPYLQSKGEEA